MALRPQRLQSQNKNLHYLYPYERLLRLTEKKTRYKEDDTKEIRSKNEISYILSEKNLDKRQHKENYRLELNILTFILLKQGMGRWRANVKTVMIPPPPFRQRAEQILQT